MWYSLVIECKYTCYIVCLHNFRVQALTHAHVEEMSAQVEAIVAEHIPLAPTADELPPERQTGRPRQFAR